MLKSNKRNQKALQSVAGVHTHTHTHTHRGISLIVLVITIVVIIILAAAVILTLNKNNLVENAKEATFKSDITSFKDELNIYISGELANSVGNRDKTINATGEAIKKYIPNFNVAKYGDKIVIKEDEVKYSGNSFNEIQWAKDIIDYEYIQNGLLLNYDGINNSGKGHDKNTKIWKDLSENGNDGVLTGFNYSDNSGWGTDFLSFDGIEDVVSSLKNVDYKGSNKVTIELVFSKEDDSKPKIILESSEDPNRNYATYYINTGEYNGVADITFALKYNEVTNNIRCVNHKKVDNVVKKNKFNQVSIQFDSSRVYDTFISIFYKGQKKELSKIISPGSTLYNYDISNLPINNYKIFIGGRASANTFSKVKVKGVRIYNRVLTDEEIKQNCEIDKIRYKLDM